MITKAFEKPHVHPETFLVQFGKASRFAHGEPNSICSITADRDLCLIKSNSVFPVWHSTEGTRSHFPPAPLVARFDPS